MASLALLTAATGCSSVVINEEPIALLDPERLTPVQDDRDPFSVHRPAEVYCPVAAWGVEDGAFEVQTGVCDYATFDQPLTTPVEAGDEVSLVVWHDYLDAARPATGHVAVWIDRRILWEAVVEIPTPSHAFEVTVPVETGFASDSRLGIHLHNHGFNSWRFIAIDLHRR